MPLGTNAGPCLEVRYDCDIKWHTVLPSPNRNPRQLYESTCAHRDIHTGYKVSMTDNMGLTGTHVVACSDSVAREKLGIWSSRNIQSESDHSTTLIRRRL